MPLLVILFGTLCCLCFCPCCAGFGSLGDLAAPVNFSLESLFDGFILFGALVLPEYTPISKNVVGENGEWQLSNGNCTTERNCGFHIWYAKTMSSSRGGKLLEGA